MQSFVGTLDDPVTVERWSGNSSYRTLVNPPVIQSILVTKVDHIGDFFLSFDALVALRQGFPEARIDLLCGPWNEELARSLRFFDRVWTIRFFDQRADGAHPRLDDIISQGLPGGTYDLAIDMRVDHDSRVLLRHVQAKFKAGFQAPGCADLLTLSLPHELPLDNQTNMAMHQSLLMLRLVQSVIDVFVREDQVRALILDRLAAPSGIDLSWASGRHLVVCNTSSGRAVKNWPLARYKSILRWLAAELDVAVLLVGSKDQMEEAADMIAYCGSKNVCSAVGLTSLRQSIGLIAKASVFIGNDSALTHIAARMGVHTIALFSAVDPPNMWVPIGADTSVLRAPVPCANCHILLIKDCRNDLACMRTISEAAVRAELRRHLINAKLFGADDLTGSGTQCAAASAEPISAI